MTIKKIQTEKAPAAIGPYSQAIRSDGLLFVSGQLGLEPATGDLVSPELTKQAKQALNNLLEIVRSGGGTVKEILSVDVYLTDIGKFVEFNDVYSEFFTDHKPARAVVQVCALPKGACVEIKCIAQC